MRNYPLYIIDRNRKAKNPVHNHDYVVCLDRRYGFVAKVLLIGKHIFDNNISKKQSFAKVIGEKVLVLLIEDFLYPFEDSEQARNTINSLLKKGLQKYLYAEAQLTPPLKKVTLENQISVQEDLVHDLKIGYEKIQEHIGEKQAKVYLACAEKTIIDLMEKLNSKS